VRGNQGSLRILGAVSGVLVALALLVGAAPVSGSLEGSGSPGNPRTPVVMFPAYFFTTLRVTVHHQTVAPECPRSGSFRVFFLNDEPTPFSKVCQMKLLTLRFDANRAKPMRLRFSDQRGVDVLIENYGKTESAPFYEPMYEALEGAGYVRDRNIRVAGYDSRLTPDMRNFLNRTKRLIEDTYHDNGNRPVHLVGHSNGPLYIQYLLTHTSQRWKDKYIHGFTPFAGNFPGQGILYPLFFTGLDVTDFTLPTTAETARAGAQMMLTAPSSYMSASDPRIFDSLETVVADASTGRSYSPADYRQLFDDAGLPWAKEIANHYVGFVQFADPSAFPNVDVYAEKGSGIETVVGIGLDDLSVGQVVGDSNPFFTRDGDINQEDITNDAVLVWEAMPCFRFSLTDNPGVDHFALPSDPDVLSRLLANLQRPRSNCR
jgi:lecithin-cholesterol acyltransferase